MSGVNPRTVMQTKEQEYWEKRLKKLREEHQSIKEKLASVKKENRALQKALRFKNDLFHSIPNGIILIQGDVIVDVNEAALDQLGYGAGEMVGRDFFSFIDPKERVNVRNLLKQRLNVRISPRLFL